MAKRLAPGWLPSVAIALACQFPAAAADNPGSKREPLSIWPVHLTIVADEYEAMQPRAGNGFPGFGPAPKQPNKPLDPKRAVHRNNFGTDLPWATGAVTIGDETFKGVGIRYKGNGTIADASRTVKKSFKIDIDQFGGEGRFLGSKSIALHSGVADPSKLRETIGYSIYRAAGVPAPRTSFAEVRLTVPGKYDGELLGLYTLTEEVDKAFLRSRFGTGDGLLMKPEGVRDIEDRGDDWDKYKKAFDPKRDATPEEGRRVVAFAKLVAKADDATFRKDIGSYLDVDAYLRFLAATAFVSNPDSFFILGHNYYLYLHPKSGRFHFIPWDLDRAFANLPIIGTHDQQMNLSLVHPYAGTHRLTERLLATPGVADQYESLLKELAKTAFSKERLLKELDAAEGAIKDLLARDAKAGRDRKDGAPTGFGSGKPPELRVFAEKRTASVAAQLAGKKGHVPAGAFRVGDIMAGPMLESIDTDKDGDLSRTEWVAIAKLVFTKAEKDAEGRADQKSLAAAMNGMFPKPPEGSPPPPPGFNLGNMLAQPIVARADADKDKKVTSEEMVAAAGAIFDKYDKGKAGKIDSAVFADLLTELFPPPKFEPPAPPKKEEPKKGSN
jgi:spore coat protein H